MWGTKIATVRSVRASASLAGSRSPVVGETSVNTGIELLWRMHDTDAPHEKGEVITSSPGPISRPISAE